MGRSALLSLLFFVKIFLTSQAASDPDLVSDLPGLTFKPNFKSYSGYLNAGETKRLHYWFVESQGNPSSDPLVLWLNGGPGCSSLDGLLSEHGPFRVSDDGTNLTENKFAWNKIANMIYLESPAGVGFSYDTKNDYATDDDQTATANYLAIKDFLSKFPEYSRSEFYITGESYGGIYVPTLAVKVLQDKHTSINFKGIAVGNGLSDVYINQDSMLFFFYYHGLLTSRQWDDLVSTCCHGVEKRCNFTENSMKKDGQKCMFKMSNIFNQIESSNLNLYNLYQECYPNRLPPGLQTLYHYLHPTQAALLKVSNPKPVSPPCSNIYGETKYLNRNDVRQALHIPDSVPGWSVCNSLNYSAEYLNMSSQYQYIIGQKKKVMLYNGDVDMVCNFLGEEWFIESMGLKEKSAMRPWKYTEYDNTTQVAGFVHEYEGLTFVTVKGSGHMVPADKPNPALQMFLTFIYS